MWETSLNQRAPVPLPPFPFGNRLSGWRVAATTSPSMLVYSADLQDDRTGLFGADP